MSTRCAPSVCALLAAAALAGCGGRLDAARSLEAGRPAVRIPYRGSGADARRWPDYGAIGAGVLTPEADAFTTTAPAEEPPRAPAAPPPAAAKKKGGRR